MNQRIAGGRRERNNNTTVETTGKTPERLDDEGPEEADEPGYNWHDSDLQVSDKMP